MAADDSPIGAVGDIQPAELAGVVADDQRGAIACRRERPGRTSRRQVTDRLHRRGVDDPEPPILPGHCGQRLTGNRQEIADTARERQRARKRRRALPQPQRAVPTSREELLRIACHEGACHHTPAMHAPGAQRRVEKRAPQDDPPGVVGGDELGSVGAPRHGPHRRGIVVERRGGPAPVRCCGPPLPGQPRVPDQPGRVPEPGGRVGAGGEHRPAIGGKGDRDSASAVGLVLNQWPFQREVPDAERVVLGGGDKCPAIGTHRHPGHRPGVPREPTELLPGRCVPQPRRAIGGRRHDTLAVGGDLRRKHGPLMAAEDDVARIGRQEAWCHSCQHDHPSADRSTADQPHAAKGG